MPQPANTNSGDIGRHIADQFDISKTRAAEIVNAVFSSLTGSP